MKIDCHVHLIGISEKSGGYLAPGPKNAFALRLLPRIMGLRYTRDLDRLERQYIEKMAGWVTESELDRLVFLSFDKVYDKSAAADEKLTQLYVPNDFVKSVRDEFPDKFLYGASVHPFRKDALEELERVNEDGAVLIKLLPNSQGFDPADPMCKPYFKKAADLKLPILMHGGFEHTIRPIDQSWGRPDKFRMALDEGATVIVAHAGSAGRFHLKETMGSFLELITKYENCYGDTSALCNLWRTQYLHQLLDPEFLYKKYKVEIENPFDKLIHGSDFPMPITALGFISKTTHKQRRKISKIKNILQRDIEIKRAVGVPDSCLIRAHELLKIGNSNF